MSSKAQEFTAHFESSSNYGSSKAASKGYYFLLEYLKVLSKKPNTKMYKKYSKTLINEYKTSQQKRATIIE
jgi:hypothetical protein